MMHRSGDSIGEPELDYETWRVVLRSLSGRYNPEGIEPSVFAGWVRPVSVCGFTALDIGANAQRIERTGRDVRLDGMEQYSAVFQVAGRSAISQNDQVASLAFGDVALIDASRPWTYLSSDGNTQWNCLSIQLPRQSLVSHLGFEPQGGICRRGTLAGRLLLDIIRNADNGERIACAAADSYMQLAIYDLVGALFAPSDPWSVSRHADKLFTRIRGVIKDRFADPDFGPSEAAAEAGISLRYLQKLFTARNSTCSDFIYSLRLDHAARLLHRRALLNTSQPISEVAYDSGFSDYTHFARKFRRRFGHPPGAHRRSD
jgi:AraC family transcriptional activator of tynA and feaB